MMMPESTTTTTTTTTTGPPPIDGDQGFRRHGHQRIDHHHDPSAVAWEEGAEDGRDDDPSSFASLSRQVSRVLMGAEELKRSVEAAAAEGGGGAAGAAATTTTAAAAATAAGQRRRVTSDDVIHWRLELENLCQCLDVLFHQFIVVARARTGSTGAATTFEEEEVVPVDVARDMGSSCHQRVLEVAHHAFRASLRMSEESKAAGTGSAIDNGMINTTTDEGDDVTFETRQQHGQAAVARIMELLLGLVHGAKLHKIPLPNTGAEEEEEDIVNSYVQYQRQVIRQRAKPCIANLVKARRHYQQARDDWERLMQHASVVTTASEFRVLAVDDDDDDDANHHVAPGSAGGGGVREPRGDDELRSAAFAAAAAPSAASIHHAASIATLLGMAAELIHPLLAWRQQLQEVVVLQSVGVPTHLHDACTRASQVVHEQVTTMVETVASWMAEDHHVDDWMEKSATADANSTSELSKSLHGLDGLVEELAYSCHVVKRYLVLVQDLLVVETSTPPSALDTLLHEWTYKYAALERHLAVQNWMAALQVAQPTVLVLGTSIQVPSFVEDAHYLSIRALQRAAGTAQSALAVGTVAHAISHDVWSMDEPVPPHSICDALTNRHGCHADRGHGMSSHSQNQRHPTSPSGAPKSGDFASAFLEALDHDVGHHRDYNNTAKSSPVKSKSGGSAPTSGNFLSLLGLDASIDDASLVRTIDAEHCMLNGIRAASTACRELATFLDSLLVAARDETQDGDDRVPSPPPTTLLEMDAKSLAMIQLAKEELFQSSNSYDAWLRRQVEDHVQSHSQCLVVLRDFFRNENYEVTASTMSLAESDDRLHRHMMAPLASSLFLSRLSDTLDSDVCRVVGDELVRVLVDKVILKVLWTRDGDENNGSAEVQVDDDDDDDPPKRFTELGALLLSKQVRMLQQFVSRTVSNPELLGGGGASAAPGGAASVTKSVLLPNYAAWERLSQVLTALQLEKPSDWLAYRYQSSSTLTAVELRRTLRLRIDFRRDAIDSVVNQVVRSRDNTAVAPSGVVAAGASPS